MRRHNEPKRLRGRRSRPIGTDRPAHTDKYAHQRETPAERDMDAALAALVRHFNGEEGTL